MKNLVVSLTVLSLGLAADPAAAQVNVIMTGLDNPRGLAMGPDGGIYVAEAGTGGNGTEITGGDGSARFGATGAVSRFVAGTQSRVITGLPSLASQAAPNPGSSATGLHDIAFSGGNLYGVIGLGADPAVRATLAADSSSFAHLVQLPLGGSPINLADLGTHEATNNPDAGLPDTNPYSIQTTPTGFVVADAGANAVLEVTPAGVVSTRSVFAPRPNPLPFGPPVFQAVPTAAHTGPDAAYYVGQLTGFPFPPGLANVYRVDATTGAQTLFADGFTNIIDLAFASDGDLLVLQLTTNGLASQTGPGTGQLIRIDSLTGNRTTLLSDPLFFPGGLLVTPDDSIFVSNLGTAAGAGQVLQIVPEPASLSLLALAALATTRRRRA